MTSVLRSIAQTDTRQEFVALTGYIQSNGQIDGQESAQHPAYAAIDLRVAKNFIIDTNPLILRTDPVAYLLRVYMDSIKPPAYSPNFEFNILFTIKDDLTKPLYINIYANKSDAEGTTFGGPIYQLNNDLPDDYATGDQIATFQVFNGKIVLKSLSPGLVG
jgi:hypothetical protein